MADYEKLGQVFESVAQGEAPRRGRLGYIVRGEYHVVDPDDPRKFLVRFESGTHVSAFHKNRVVQKPDQPVLIINDKLGRPEILGVDPAGNEGFDTGSGNAGVGLHDHVRGSGRDFIIDTWLLKQLRASVSTAFTVAIAEGGYMWHGAVRWFTASSVDLSSYVPTGIGFQRWVVIAINPTSGGLVTVTGDEYFSDSYQERYRIASIAVTQAGYIPLAAVWMRSIDTQLYNYQIEDLRFLPGSLIWYLADLYNVYDDYDYYGYVLGYDGENWVGTEAGTSTGGGVGGLLIPPTGIGQFKYDPDGAQVVKQVVVQPGILLIPIEGELYTFASGLRVSNEYGVARTVNKVKALVGTAPVGDDIIIDILKNGTTIFTNPANRPVIADGANSGETTTIDVETWGIGDYLQVQIVQIGSTTPGSDLTVHICYT